MAKDTKERILMAALKMFSEKGYEGTNIRELTQSLGLVKSSMYRHFKSKEEIWNTLLDEMVAYYSERFGSPEHMPPVPDSQEELVLMTLRLADFTIHDEKVAMSRKLLSIEQFRDDRVRVLATRHFLTGLQDMFTGIFAGMMEKGLLRRDDPAVLALSYTAPISALIHRCDREPEKIPDTMKEIETFSRHFIRTYGETRWFDPEDQSKPVIDPPSQIADKYPDMEIPVLPPRAVVFCLGRGLPILKEHYSCYSIMEKLPGFITHSEVLGIKGTPGICFLHGGYAAPQIACTIETLHVLGVKDICLIGLCGGFDERLSVGDVVLPGKIWSEEGTSRHYMESPGFAEVTPSDSFRGIFAFFREKGYQVFCEPTVTTDAVYRQTFEKEASWRGKGCVAVDMEASAFVNLCNIHGIKNTVILMVSDRHPIREEDSDWHWGTTGFGELTTKFILDTIAYLEEENHG